MEGLYSIKPSIVTVVVSCVAAGVVTIITFPKFLKRIKRKSVEPKEVSKLKGTTWVPIGSVKQLIIYPIMAGKEYNVTDCTFEEEGISATGENKGVLRDKMFVIYDEDTHCVQTCRNFTLMFKLKVVDIDNNTVCFKDGEDKLMVDIKHSTLARHNIVECKAWNNSSETLYYLECVDCGAEAASWISNSLTGKNVGLRLGYFVNKTLKILTLWDTFCGLGDVRGSLKKTVKCEMEKDKEMPNCTLIAQQSLEHVNKSLLRVKMPHDFSANLIITVQKPFTESQYGHIRVGDDVVISNVKPWKRPKVNPLQIPNDLRLKLMSIHCRVLSTGKVNVNDKVYIPIDSYE